eukprot:5643394-Amphidinium_carterae.2
MGSFLICASTVGRFRSSLARSVAALTNHDTVRLCIIDKTQQWCPKQQATKYHRMSKCSEPLSFEFHATSHSV